MENKCPTLTAKEYQRGFDNGLTFDGFRGKSINWKVGELVGDYNEDGDLELIGTDKQWKESLVDIVGEDLDDKLRMEYQDNMRELEEDFNK